MLCRLSTTVEAAKWTASLLNAASACVTGCSFFSTVHRFTNECGMKSFIRTTGSVFTLRTMTTRNEQLTANWFKFIVVRYIGLYVVVNLL